MLSRSNINDSLFASGPSWASGASQVEILISRACNPSIPEPNYALNLEVADYINQKKANTPRESATVAVRLVNHRNPHISMLALALLDTLAQACGYAFHLQISTKEFLNELVRRFPERPPPFPGPVMTRILELIHTWKETICTDSRWKEDLGNIRDMHRLLTFKGYRFRELPRANAPSASNLKSAEELEEEDREAQAAKLQELIRRGTPRDLAAAQELMKSLSGANPEAKPDYRQQALSELNKLESKVILLNEMLDNVDTSRGEKFAAGDVYDQVGCLLSNARPKIQKWISDAESQDPESLDTFLQINDQINTVLSRYESFKKGDFVAAANPIPQELASTSTRNELSLIDLDDSAPSDASAQPASSGIDDLDVLFGPRTSVTNPTTTTPPNNMSSSMFSNNPYGVQNNGFTSTSAPGTPRPILGATPNQFGSIALPTTPPQYQNQSHSGRTGISQPHFFQNNSLANVQPQVQRPPSQPQQPQQFQTTLFQVAYGQKPPSRQATPSQQPQAQAPSQLGRATSPRQPFVQQQQPIQPQLQPSQIGQPLQPQQPQGKDPFADLAGLF
ncbi:VHS domain-containing protein [Thelephora terrestris]|uniref:VHS domain-containing protein n=1 Tax=Thelephora terrestris TaxID=56493 RepID=A0A9P6L930_9AGAM|nr:VHS domain-containing protein [Thelephora terrestris]